MTLPFTAFPIPTALGLLTQQNVTTPGTTTLTSVGVVVLVNVSALVTIILPAPGSAQDTIWIKDFGGNAQSFNITITPSVGKTIDGLISFTIASNHGILRLYALADLTGWYVG